MPGNSPQTPHPHPHLVNCPEKLNSKGPPGGGITHLKRKVPILLRELVNFAVHLALLCLQVLALFQSFMEPHGKTVREEQ